MEGAHFIVYAGAAVGGGIGLYLPWLILAELRSLNRYFRKGIDETDTLRSSSGRSRRSGGGSSRSGQPRV